MGSTPISHPCSEMRQKNHAYSKLKDALMNTGSGGNKLDVPRSELALALIMRRIANSSVSEKSVHESAAVIWVAKTEKRIENPLCIVLPTHGYVSPGGFPA